LSLITESKQTIAVTSHRRDKTGRLASGGGEHEFHIIARCLPAVGFAFAVWESGYYNS
jgi:hypothetical protein